jgi:hypothetical protein
LVEQMPLIESLYTAASSSSSSSSSSNHSLNGSNLSLRMDHIVVCGLLPHHTELHC